MWERELDTDRETYLNGIHILRAIEESLALSMGANIQQAPPPSRTEHGFEIEPEGDIAIPGGLAVTPGGSILDSEMAMALSLSQRHQEEEEARRRQEEETLKRILELSLTEK